VEVSVSIVVPTTGRPTLQRLLDALGAADGPLPEQLLLVDDRRDRGASLALRTPARLGARLCVVPGPGRGPASARNVGWRAARSEWIAFLDDDVVPQRDWLARLHEDLAGAPPDVAGVQGSIVVPRPVGRRPTDWERNVAGLEHARWATADMAYRREALLGVGGFDERFRRAYREDAELALRLRERGRDLVRGSRRVLHPVGPASPLVSLRLQAGNADDVLMASLHGRRWRERSGAFRGRRARHSAVTLAGVLALAGAAAGRPRLSGLAAAGFTAGVAELAWARIAPGPRTPREIALMLLTSAAMPPLAVAHALTGYARWRGLLVDRLRTPRPSRAHV
jgi:glycosyltransferase involved in cell wall biosynthesis